MAPIAATSGDELELLEGFDVDDHDVAYAQTRVQTPQDLPKGETALVPVPVGMDWPLLATIAGLMTVGTIMAYSASVWLGLHNFNGNDAHFLQKHLAHLCVAVFVLIVAIRTPYQLYRRLAYPLMGFSLVGLVAVLAFGKVVNNARRWLVVGGLPMQVAELAKFAFVIYLAHALTKQISRKSAHKFSVGFVPHAVVWGVAFVLLMKEPDLGSGIVLAILLFAMTFIAGTNFAYIFGIGGVGIAALGLFIAHNPMRAKRIVAFGQQVLSVLGMQDLPREMITGASYQWFNGRLAVATGGLFGNGLGMSRQKLGFVPEAHTDWVLSIIAEELGLIGVALVALAFIFVIRRGLRIALRARDEFGRLLASGITILLGTQAAVNFGVVMGTLPTKGLTLPFVSHGGSSLIVLSLAAGVLLNVGRGGDPDFEFRTPTFLQRFRTQPPAARSPNTRVIVGAPTGGVTS